MMEDDKSEKRILASLFKALKDRTETLRYFRVQVLEAMSKNMHNLTDEEVEEYILWMKNEQAQEKRQI